jgi:DNA-binding MarR family transcriptional regulator
MDTKYQTLRTLATMVQEEPQPTLYRCMPRELILRSDLDWATIYSHLAELEKEAYVQIFNADGVRFSITQTGIEKANGIQAEVHSDLLFALKKITVS